MNHPVIWIFIKLLIMVMGFILLRQSGAFSSEAILRMTANPIAVIAMVGLAISYDFIRGFALYWIIRQTGGPAPFWACVKAQFIGHFFNFFLPGQAGGFGAKSIYLSRTLGVPWARVVNVLSVELFMGFLALTTFTAINTSMLALKSTAADLSQRAWIYALISIVLTAGPLFLLRKMRKAGWLVNPTVAQSGWKSELHRAASWIDRWPLCLQIGALALVTYFMKCLVLLIAAQQLNAPPTVDYAAICASFSLGVMVSLIPIAPGGLLTGNLGFGSTLALLTGTPFALGADIYTALWAVHGALGVLGGLIFLLERFRSPPKSGLHGKSRPLSHYN